VLAAVPEHVLEILHADRFSRSEPLIDASLEFLQLDDALLDGSGVRGAVFPDHVLVNLR
jgi:hypothetical protein